MHGLDGFWHPQGAWVGLLVTTMRVMRGLEDDLVHQHGLSLTWFERGGGCVGKSIGNADRVDLPAGVDLVRFLAARSSRYARHVGVTIESAAMSSPNPV